MIFCLGIASCSDESVNSNPAQGLKAESVVFNSDPNFIEDSIKAHLTETTTADTENVILVDKAYVVFEVVPLDDLERSNRESQLTFQRTLLQGRAILKIHSIVCEISDRNISLNDLNISSSYFGEFYDLESNNLVLWVSMDKTTLDDEMSDHCKN